MSGGKYPDRDPQMFYELARDRHAGQAAALDSLDSKLSLFLTSSSTLLGILIAVYALRPDAFGGWETAVAIASGSAWLLSTGIVLIAFRPLKLLTGPVLQEVFDRQFTDEDDATMQWHVANHFWQDYRDNKKREVQKANALALAQWLLVIQTVLLVVALALVAHDQRSDTSHRSHTPSAVAHDAPAWDRKQGADRTVLALADPRRPSCESLTASYAARGTARARSRARLRRASIVRSA